MNPIVAQALARIIKDPMELLKPCVPVAGVVAVDHIIADMVKVCKTLDRGKDLGCCGLAANQLGYNLRIIVLKKHKVFIAYINPVLELGGDVVESKELCFSFPGKKSTVSRHTSVRLTADNFKEGFVLHGREAIAAQHEIDHLNGVLI